MSHPISKQLYDKLHTLARENPHISNAEIGRRLGIGKDAVAKWRSRGVYPYTPQVETPAQEPISNILNAGAVPYGIDQLNIREEHYLKRENRQLKQQIQEMLDERIKADKLTEFSELLAENPVKIPDWIAKSHTGKNDIAVPMAFASDWHLDEVVNLAQMDGVNEYNRKIAVARAENFFDNTVRLAEHYVSGIRYDGIYLLLGGDLFSGNIHEELKQTNEATIIESILYWVEPVASGIRYLADKFQRVHIPCVVGNHGRLTHKPVAKNRVQDNFDFLFYNMLAMSLRDDKRITWDIAQSADCRFTVLDTAFLLTHGDQFKGGNGIAGLLSPLLIGDHRKRKKHAALHRPYDWMVMGHWHQLILGVMGILVNGSLKGYDEFATIYNFAFEPPQQALWLVQPRRGVTMRWPIHVMADSENYKLSA